MDDPFYAMLFAEDLVDYVLRKFGKIWYPIEGSARSLRQHIGRTRFTKEIGEAVTLIIKVYEDTVRECYERLRAMDTIGTDAFRREGSITLIMNFPRGYDPESYLLLCALFSGVSVHFYPENRGIADVSAQLLAYVINFYVLHFKFDPRRQYFELAYVAQKLRRKYGTMPKINGSGYTVRASDIESRLPTGRLLEQDEPSTSTDQKSSQDHGRKSSKSRKGRKVQDETKVTRTTDNVQDSKDLDGLNKTQTIVQDLSAETEVRTQAGNSAHSVSETACKIEEHTTKSNISHKSKKRRKKNKS